MFHVYGIQQHGSLAQGRNMKLLYSVDPNKEFKDHHLGLVGTLLT